MGHAHLVNPGSSGHLSEVDPDDHGSLEKEEAGFRLHEIGLKLEEMLELMAAAGKHSLLIVFQGMDTSGKDGSIKGILNFANVQSSRVVSFKQPTPIELSHDFLWRVHAQAPRRGGLTIFNRSHYEDVLITRVHKLIDKDCWKKRYDQINQFEELLVDSGTIILKFFLHISKAEQEQRLLDREKDPDKSWKLSVGDWKERELWKEYQEAYEDAIHHCSTQIAPWYVVPANHKWFRDLAIMETIESAISPHRDEWHHHLKEIGKVATQELDSFRKSQASAKKP